jgi:enediyne biosynthesis protein E4
MGGSAKSIARPSARARPDLPSPNFEVRDIAASSGLTAANVYGGVAAKKHILEMTGNGVAAIDFDNDGWRDLLFINGTRIGATKPEPHRLYRNTGKGQFLDVTDGSGLANQGWGNGVCAGDYDNDGKTDVLITYYGHNELYRNGGKGRFENVTRAVGLPGMGQRWATGCAFLDYDRDGRLDLFASNYVGFDLTKAAAPGSSPFCFWKGLAVFCGPKGFPTGHNALYRNDGGRFTDVSNKAGILVEGLHYALGVVTADFDDDQWPDIYVACDSTPSLLYRNNRDGTFTDVSVEAGTAYGESGQEQGSMGAAAGDYDNDGRPDLVRTNFMHETPTLYRNLGEWFFEDSTYTGGLGVHTGFVGWGVQFIDFDHDGWKDVIMANGHIYPELEKSKLSEPYRQSRLLYWNLKNGAFRDITGTSPLLQQGRSSRGLATADFDGDGTLEIVAVNMNEAPSLYQLHTARGNALIVELAGTKSNRSAIGARVSVEAGELRLAEEVRSGSGFASQSDFRLHFGLGKASAASKVAIRWPSGATEEFAAVGANQFITIKEGSGIVAQRPFGGNSIR